MRNILSLLFIILFSSVSTDCLAQAAAQKLYNEGQKLQQTMTVAAQKKAIAQYTKAKKAFDSQARKNDCDNQIAICKKNIKYIIDPKPTPKPKPTPHKDVDTDTVLVDRMPTTEPVKISLSVSSVEFKSGGKKKDNHQVVVSCNYDSWNYTAPKWIHITRNGNTITLTAEANTDDEERSGTVVVTCKGKRAELMVYQASKFKLKNILKL